MANDAKPFDWANEFGLSTVYAPRLARFLASPAADEWLARRIDREAWTKREYFLRRAVEFGNEDREADAALMAHNAAVVVEYSLTQAREIRLGLDAIATGGETT